MKDATMGQGKGLFELLLQTEDPYVFTQNLIERWGAVQLIGRGEVTQAKLIEALSHIETNPYASEKVKASFSYPSGYKPKSVGDQVKVLLARYDWLDVRHIDSIAKSWGKFAQADGLYVIPKPTSLASRLDIAEHWANFGLLTEQGPLEALASQRKFTNLRAGRLGLDRYRLAASAKSALEALEAEQPEGDLLVFPAQTGKLLAGFSPRNSRWDIEHATNPAQWPLPAYVVGWIVYCNPHRLEKYDHLVIDCPGDEYRFGGSAEAGLVLCFDFDGGELCCYCGDGAYPNGSCGSGSGFLR